MEQKTTKELIIKGLENWVKNHKDQYLPLAYSSVVELLDFINEQENEIENLKTLLLGMKEQETVKPITEHHFVFCPVCKNTLFREQKFCDKCGKRIDWEGW